MVPRRNLLLIFLSTKLPDGRFRIFRIPSFGFTTKNLQNFSNTLRITDNSLLGTASNYHWLQTASNYHNKWFAQHFFFDSVYKILTTDYALFFHLLNFFNNSSFIFIWTLLVRLAALRAFFLDYNNEYYQHRVPVIVYHYALQMIKAESSANSFLNPSWLLLLKTITLNFSWQDIYRTC